MRWFVGFLLIAAALLKAAQLFKHPSSVLTDETSRYFVPLLIGCELGLGLTAIMGLYWRLLRLLAMALFAGFACYSLFLAISGAASCGCFGSLEINPWWTFILDLIVFTGLFAEYRTKRPGEIPQDAATENFSSKIGIASTAILSMAVAIGLAWHVAPHPQSVSQESFQTVGDLIILEPENWVGKKFPLLEHIDLDVSQGNWVLLLHHHDCPECQEALPKYQNLAARLQEKASEERVILVETPPYNQANVEEPSMSPCLLGRLSDKREWFVQTPVEIRIREGRITGVSKKLPSLRSIF